MAPRSSKPAFLHGTSGWSYKDWAGPFYPPGTPSSKYLERYAERFPAVEVDSTFYRIPSEKTTRAWGRAVPEGFVFVPKMVRDVTHERFLEGAGETAARFLDSVAPLEGKLGPVILQFRYFKKAEGVSLEALLARLLPFLDALPEGFRFAVELRNKSFLTPALFAELAGRRVSLVLNDHPWMPRPRAWLAVPGVFTAGTVLVRLLGDRYAIEKVTKTWGAIVVDKEEVVQDWARLIDEALARGRSVAAFVNNHFAGFAPASAELLARLVRGGPESP